MARRSRKRSKSKTPILIFLVILIVAVAVGGIYVFGGTRSVNLDSEISITIPEGSSAQTITEILDENDLVFNKVSFDLFVRTKNAAAMLKPGEYTFGPGKVTYSDILTQLIEGNIALNTVTVTIPEGYTVAQIAAGLEEDNVIIADDFLNYAASLQIPYEYIPQGNDYTQLEGFLYPDTYNIGKNWTAPQIVDLMLTEFNKKWTADRQARADELGLTVKEVITVASLIEEEARIDEDRATISSVIYNRLNSGMKLQIDATVQYAVGHKDRLLYSDLEIDSPYNTYKYSGLPVGPIANPGIASIDAALYPAQTNYYYYQTSTAGDGSHYFCETYDEHVSYKAQKN